MRLKISLLFELIAKPAFSFIRFLARKAGYKINISKFVKNKNKQTALLNLNIGAGSYEIENFLSLDIYTKHYYKNKKEFLKKRIEYNIRKDMIPFKDSVVDNIYISHVIEHIEDKYFKNFLKESYRVLKKGGVLRIACPDAEFLYSVSKFKNEYWNWRVESLSNEKRYETNWQEINQYDFLLRELSTPRMRFYKNKINSKQLDMKTIKNLEYKELSSTLRKDLVFRDYHPGDHINNWDFDRLKLYGKEFKFKNIIKSKPQGSVSSAMSTPDFDRTQPNMSLYVEFIK